jgi:hypothetical protein
VEGSRRIRVQASMNADPFACRIPVDGAARHTASAAASKPLLVPTESRHQLFQPPDGQMQAASLAPATT